MKARRATSVMAVAKLLRLDTEDFACITDPGMQDAVRYHCTVCANFDFCEECYKKKRALKQHKPSHHMAMFMHVSEAEYEHFTKHGLSLQRTPGEGDGKAPGKG